jgi:hypothetical protein
VAFVGNNEGKHVFLRHIDKMKATVGPLLSAIKAMYFRFVPRLTQINSKEQGFLKFKT